MVPHDIRFGTWITTANFCHIFLLEIRAFILSLSLPKSRISQAAFESEIEQQQDTNRIRKLQHLVQDGPVFDQLRRELAFVNKYYSEIPKLIYKLEDNQLTLCKASDMVDLVTALLRLPAHECDEEEKEKAEKVFRKLESGLEGNTEYIKLVQLCRSEPESMFNYATIHSMDCERFFAKFRMKFSAPHRHIHDSIKMITACTAAFRPEESTTDGKKVSSLHFYNSLILTFCFVFTEKQIATVWKRLHQARLDSSLPPRWLHSSITRNG